MQEVRKLIAQKKQAEMDRLQDAEAEYAELLGKIVAGNEVEESAAAACDLLIELGRSIDDLERDVRVYTDRLTAIENLQRLPELTAARQRAHDNFVATKKEAEEAIRKIQAGLIAAENDYSLARIRETDASYAADTLATSLPSWMAAEQGRPRQLNAEISENEPRRVNHSELPGGQRARLLSLARKPIAWPLPRDAAQSAT